MEDFAALIDGLHGLSIALGLGIGLLGGFLFAMLTYRFYGKNFRSTFERLGDEMKNSYDGVTDEMKASFKSLSSEALADSQSQFLSLADRELDKKTEQHATELESKKELIDTQLQSMSKSMTDTLNTVPTELEKNQTKVAEVLDKSAEQIKESNKSYLDQLTKKSETQTKQHIAELEEKKKLIDQQLEQMSTTLKTVPTELDKNRQNVSEVIEKTTKSLEESNKTHLTQLQDRSDTQSKEHVAKLDEKELQINRRLGEMDEKLGKVQALIDEFEKARESKLGALDDQLKNLTQTTSELHLLLVDNQARGRWGERIAEQILEHLGMSKGISYLKQEATPSGDIPDFTFLLPNRLQINMDCKFPVDNYNSYFSAENKVDKEKYRKSFLQNVEKHVTDVTNRDYIHGGTVDCVLIFIPNEQIYSFIHQEGSKVIDKALARRVIICSPLTLYIILAVIRQASENFAIEQRSQEVLDVLKGIEKQWGEYTKLMDGMGKNFRTLQGKFEDLTGTRTRQLDRQFARIESIKSDVDNGDAQASSPLLTEESH